MIPDSYIAGFFDGEGSVGVYLDSKKKSFHLRTQISQNETKKSIELFKFLVVEFGGHYSRQETLSEKTKLNFQLGPTQSTLFLSRIYPHLLLKKRQVELALKFQELKKLLLTRSTTTGRFEYDTRFFEIEKAVSITLKLLKYVEEDTEYSVELSTQDVLLDLENAIVLVKG